MSGTDLDYSRCRHLRRAFGGGRYSFDSGEAGRFRPDSVGPGVSRA